MPSRAFAVWSGSRRTTLDEIKAAHRQVGGIARGRRHATSQLNHAYALILAAQFQGYCRDLHTEAAGHAVAAARPLAMQPAVHELFVSGRKLDFGNPNVSGLGSDFGRFGMKLWPSVESDPRFRPPMRAALEALCVWRNALAHQDFKDPRLKGRTSLRLIEVKGWHRRVDQLAMLLDDAVRSHLAVLLGASPW